VSCAVEPSVKASHGVLDLRDHDWEKGPVALNGEWAFNDGWRQVPDVWFGSEAGGRDGMGSGVYHLKVLLPLKAVPLALRWQTASTALSLRSGPDELARVGNPDSDAKRAIPAYAPGTVRLSPGPVLDLEVFVSNHVYRIGGLWEPLTLGPVARVEWDQWVSEAGSLVLASALTVIAFAALLLFLFRRSDKTFLHLGVFAILVAIRSLVTGEYTLVRLLPAIPFDLLIRLEYLTAFLPLPSATLFFAIFFPGLFPRWGVRLMTWPSWGFALATLVLPLDLLTRSIVGFYPFSVPALIVGATLLVRRIVRDRHDLLLLLGVGILATAGLADMFTAAFLSTTGSMVPWGLGLFVALQAATLARRFLAAFEATEALLAEKELLVKEIHHRVKNSLQVVASLVSLQSNRTKDPEQKALFSALRHRITAIALVHEKLYGKGFTGRPDVGNYLTDLLKLQYPPDALTGGRVTWAIHADPLSAGIDYCIDAGLIVTELVGNAHKHALLPRGGHLEVTIRIREGRLEIQVQDDGPGFTADFRPETSRGLGFRLILALLQRNNGTLSIEPGPGGRVRVDLKLPSAAG